MLRRACAEEFFRLMRIRPGEKPGRFEFVLRRYRAGKQARFCAALDGGERRTLDSPVMPATAGRCGKATDGSSLPSCCARQMAAVLRNKDSGQTVRVVLGEPSLEA
jgi:hypothetical protein